MDMCSLLVELGACTMAENEGLLELIAPSVKAVLKAVSTKNVVAMREIQFIAGSMDVSSPGLLLIGLPMLGWTPAATGLLPRISGPQMTIQEWEDHRDERNAKILRSLGPSGDDELDKKTYEISCEERALGVMEGPFQSLADLPFSEVGIVPRKGIWEMHGDAMTAKARGIDNMLMGEQNATVGTLSAHRPTDPDGLVAQCRAVESRYPNHTLSGWPSDFKKAYKQIPAFPPLVSRSIIGQWSPKHRAVVFWITWCQLFGGKSPPLNFARYPAWMCGIVAALFALPVSHCVDDMICVEPEVLALSGNYAWRIFCCVLGWWISEDKSPLPADRFLVIGVMLDLTETPDKSSTLRISDKRMRQLDVILDNILECGYLGSGQAASITGKLGFSLCSCFGKFGRAMLRPFIRRSMDNHTVLNNQLLHAIAWWKEFLRTYTPRNIPIALSSIDICISYSDGEGELAGVGIAVWSPRNRYVPVAAYMQIPSEVRELWSMGNGTNRSDIFQIEAVGPLLVLSTFPNMVRNLLWVHFIDNVASQHALIKGSSSIAAGDVLVGHTWQKIRKLHVWAYFDRVASSSNPVDGLSRRDHRGPWGEVHATSVPADMIRDLQQAAVWR